jgi:hypothetical protein
MGVAQWSKDIVVAAVPLAKVSAAAAGSKL